MRRNQMIINSNVPEHLRDVQMAADVGKMAELAYFDVEFTMYGCAYLKNGKVHYRISSEAEDIYSFLESSVLEDIFPSNVLELTEKCPVPSGMRPFIAQEVKVKLARKLKALYPKEFFELLNKASEVHKSNSTLLHALHCQEDELEGLFDEEKLNMFEQMLQYIYFSRKISRKEYVYFVDWLKKERQNMDDTFVSKDLLEKHMYGIAYETSDKVKYIVNAQHDRVCARAEKLRQEGKFVTPVYSKTYWYKHNMSLFPKFIIFPQHFNYFFFIFIIFHLFSIFYFYIFIKLCKNLFLKPP